LRIGRSLIIRKNIFAERLDTGLAERTLICPSGKSVNARRGTACTFELEAAHEIQDAAALVSGCESV
jgi:hypothetical protein